MEIFILWLLLAIVVGIAARARGRSGFAFFILAVILSPLIGLIIVLVLPNLRHERLLLKVAGHRERNIPFEPEGMYGDIPYRVTRSGAVEALMPGSVVRFKSADHMFNALSGDSAVLVDAPTPSKNRSWRRQFGVVATLIALLGIAGGLFLYALKVKDDQQASAATDQLASESALASS